MERIAIEANEVGKRYRIYPRNLERWMDFLLPGERGRNFWALKKVSFQVRMGEFVGLIGLNGSGKSTLSNLIAGVSRPSVGSLRVTGDAAMIAINVGLNAQLTGMENIEMKGLLIGLNHKQIRALAPEIIDFSGIREFIAQPVKTYSSGMRARLAFSIAINVNPQILVIDEGLTVGDSTFTDKCLARIESFQKEGKTLIMTSHSAQQIKNFCKRLIWLDNGEIRMDGDSAHVMQKYAQYLKWHKTLTNEEKAERAREQYAARCRDSV